MTRETGAQGMYSSIKFDLIEQSTTRECERREREQERNICTDEGIRAQAED